MELYSWKQSSPKPHPARLSWSISEDITLVCCGEQFTLFLTGDGKVLSSGHNSKGQLGRIGPQDQTKPGRLSGFRKAVSLACGQDHSLLLSTTGDVYTWGAGGDGQLGVEPITSMIQTPSVLPFQIPVAQVACGNSHSLALTKAGDVYSWGSNSHGQLGLGRDVPVQPLPGRVRSLTGIPVTLVAAGGNHTLFLTLSGLVYCCGANKAGQLGLDRVDDNGRFNIVAVPPLKPLEVVAASCGAEHSVVLTKDGRVFTFGDGSHGQLGHCSTASERKPREVQGIDETVSQIACGSHHTLILGSSGHVWTFGSGVEGQSGSDASTPVPVQLPWESDDAAPVTKEFKIAAGWNTNYLYLALESSTRDLTTGRFDEEKLQTWQAMREGDQETIKEMQSMFVTSSSLVASFAKHNLSPLTTGELIADVKASARAFDQLLQINVSIVAVHLEEARALLKSPDAILVLLTCPLLQEDTNVMQVVIPLAMAITELNEKTSRILRSCWSSLPPAILTNHIAVFKNAVSFLLRNGCRVSHGNLLKILLETLKMLYKANKVEQSLKVPASTFYIDQITLCLDPIMEVSLWVASSRMKDEEKEKENIPVVFCQYPFVFHLICKIGIFNIHSQYLKEEPLQNITFCKETQQWMFQNNPDVAPVFHLKLRRTHLVEDTFLHLSSADHTSFQRRLSVQFTEEQILTQVQQKDFFINVFEELMAPESKMFMYNDDKTLVWFPAEVEKAELKKYFLFGVLCGIAMYNHNIINLPFPLVLYKKLVNMKHSYEDMKEFEPIMANSFHCILKDYTTEDFDTLDFIFTVGWDGRKVDLDPTAKEKPVSCSNKKEFVNAYLNYAFNKSVEKVFVEFKRGFFKVCDRDMVEFFQPEELRDLIVGQEFTDWTVMKENTVYEGVYSATHPNIIAFWETFEELTEDQKRRFLLFLTGLARVPVHGLKMVHMTVAILPNATELHFPEALTCHSLLLLPNYRRYPAKRRLKNRLLEAIYHTRGFWRE